MANHLNEAQRKKNTNISIRSSVCGGDTAGTQTRRRHQNCRLAAPATDAEGNSGLAVGEAVVGDASGCDHCSTRLSIIKLCSPVRKP